MDREYSCFFTGHRYIKKIAEPSIRKAVRSEAERLINDEGVVDFIAGGALGFDTIAAKEIISLKEKYDYIKLHLYLPCFNQMENWNERDKYTGRMIMSYCDSKTYITEGNYVTGCMHLRNKQMAKDAKFCIAYMTKPQSGTAYTVSCAEDFGGIVINIANEIY